MHRLPFPASESHSEGVLDLIHSDLLMISHPSLGGARYIVTFIDDHSRKLWIYLLKAKSDTFSTFRAFKAMVELQTGRKIRVLRADGGGEYCSNVFKAFMEEQGIVFQTTVPHTPQQNGTAERINCSLAEQVHTMLIESSLLWSLWAEAAAYFTYTKNRSPHRAINGVPEQVFRGKPPLVSHLWPF